MLGKEDGFAEDEQERAAHGHRPAPLFSGGSSRDQYPVIVVASSTPAHEPLSTKTASAEHAVAATMDDMPSQR